MSQLQPVPNDYEPRYPRELSEQEIRDLLRPSLLSRFSNEVFLTGALVAGIAATGGNADANERNTISKDPMLKAQVDRLLQEVLGKYKSKTWNPRTSIKLSRELKTNPPVKYPSIPISFGNSYIGVFDTKAAKEVTANRQPPALQHLRQRGPSARVLRGVLRRSGRTAGRALCSDKRGSRVAGSSWAGGRACRFRALSPRRRRVNDPAMAPRN